MLVRICDWAGTEIWREDINLPVVGLGADFATLPIAERAVREAEMRGEIIKIFAGTEEQGEISPNHPRYSDGSPRLDWSD